MTEVAARDIAAELQMDLRIFLGKSWNRPEDYMSQTWFSSDLSCRYGDRPY
jgi:hypothetical protein